MKLFSFASSPVVVAVTVAVVAARIPNQRRTPKQQRLMSPGRRHLLHRHHFPSGLSCHLYLKDVEYGPTSDEPDGYSTDEWFCELSEEDSVRLGVEQPYYLDIDDSLSILFDGVIPGQSTLFASDATIDYAETKLYIPENATVSVEGREESLITLRSRNLMAKKGTLEVLMIRVIDGKGVSPEADLDQLRDDVFLDGASLKTQYEACSYGKLKIQPFSGRTETNVKISGGVANLSIDYRIIEGSDRKVLQKAAIVSASESFGDLKSQFDVIMFCMPPGTGNWLAYAFVGGQYSFYNNRWCSYMSAQLHEVGHNLGCVA
jgi:hypothetical protein